MFQMPAIEWSPQVVSGDSTNADPTIENVADTSLIEVGMVLPHASFPYNSRVLSKTVDSITMDQDATVTGSSSFTFYKRFEFDYPAQKDNGETGLANQSVARALSGGRQVLTNFIDMKRVVVFEHIPKSYRDILRDEFYLVWAIYGKTFRYFDDKAINSFVTYYLDASDYPQERQTKAHPDYKYKLTYRFSRVL